MLLVFWRSASFSYLQRESDLLIRVSYHTLTAFEKHERAPDTSLYFWWQQCLIFRMNFVILNPQRNPRIQPRIDMSFENLLLKLKIEENIFENENFSEFVLPIFFLKIVISLRKSRCHICIKDRNLLSNDFG